MRLSEQPVDDGWWLFVQVDGVVYQDGELLDENGNPWVRWVPSVGWEVDQDNAPGPTPWRNVRIHVLHDDDDEDELLTFTHEVWDEHSNCPPFLHAVAPVTVRIIDDERAGGVPALEIGDASVTEGGLATFDVTLSAGAPGTVTVAYQTVNGTATAGSDYTSASGTLSFGTRERTKQVEVQTLEDQAPEGTETFTVRLSAATGATVADGSGTGTIVDDDESPTLTIGDAAPVEEGGTAEFMARLSSASGLPVTVAYRTVDGTAVTGLDYTAAEGTLHFEAGETTHTLTVGTLTDDLLESLERFTVELHDAEGATLADEAGAGTITDDVKRSTRAVHRVVIPEMGRAMAFTTNCRIEQARAGAEPPTVERALDDLVFLMSSQEQGGSGRLAAWGCADSRSLSGGDNGAAPWNGDVFSAHLGADVRISSDVLAGFSLSRSRGSFGYRMGGNGGEDAGGAYRPRLTGIHPCVVWSVTPALNIWATFGHGWGKLQFANDLAETDDTSASTLDSGTVGLSGRVFVRGATSVRVEGRVGTCKHGPRGSGRRDVRRAGSGCATLPDQDGGPSGTLPLIRPLAQSVGGASAQARRGRWRGRSRPRGGRRTPLSALTNGVQRRERGPLAGDAPRHRRRVGLQHTASLRSRSVQSRPVRWLCAGLGHDGERR